MRLVEPAAGAAEGEQGFEIRKAAIANGMTTLVQDGVRKAVQGVTTVEAVLRTAKADDRSRPRLLTLCSRMSAILHLSGQAAPRQGHPRPMDRC